MRKLNSNRGMTLVEVLTAVAILVIVAAVAFPRFQGWRESTRKAACDANLADMQQQLDTWQLKHRETLETLSADQSKWDSVTADIFEGHTCPLHGTYEINPKSGRVYCSKHNPEASEVTGSSVDTMHKLILSDWETIQTLIKGSKVDSASQNGATIAALKEQYPVLNEVTGSWQIIFSGSAKGTNILYASSVDINKELNSGDYAVVLRYNITNSTAAYAQLYSVWKMRVDSTTENGETYNIFGTIAKESRISASTPANEKKDYATMFKQFQDAESHLDDADYWCK